MNNDWLMPALALIAAGGITAGFFLGRIDAQAYIGVMASAITFFTSSKVATAAIDKAVAAAMAKVTGKVEDKK